MIGKTLSHYKVIEKIGKGGMGEVYLAEDSRLDRKVALKILPQHLSERAELRERFEREARAVLKITPRTVAFHKYRMMSAFNVSSNAELIRYAVRRRIG